MHDLRFAFRQLLKHPAFTTLAVFTLALGIGVNTALFSVVHAVMLRPLPYPDQDRLITLWESSPAQGANQIRVSPPTLVDWKEQSTGFAALAYWTGPAELNLMTSEGAQKVRTSYPSSELFPLLGVQPILGRIFEANEDERSGPPTAVISQRFWREHFEGDPQVLGRTLTLDSYGRRTYTVVGVMPAGFEFPDRTALWIASGWNGLSRNRREGHWLEVLGRLRPSVSLEQARAELNGIQARIAQAHAGDGPGTEVSAVPLLQQAVGRSTRTTFLVLWGVVGGVLLIACGNVANLMLARAASRQAEFALRLALGAGRPRLVRQLLTESLLLSLLGGVVGIAFAALTLNVFLALSPANIPRLEQVGLDRNALVFTLGVAVVTGVLSGLVPAWKVSGADWNEALKAAGRSAADGLLMTRPRGALVVFQVALAAVLLSAAGLLLQSLSQLLLADRGFRSERVLTAELDFSVSGYSTWVRPTLTRPQVGLHELLERVRQLPGVRAAGAAYRFLRQDNRPPVNWHFAIHGRPPLSREAQPNAEQNAISPGYLAALGVPILRGRDFTDSDTLDAPGVALVNETFVRRFFPNEDPLGRFITGVTSPGAPGSRDNAGVPNWYQIVGVVGDTKSLTTQPEPAPEIFRSYWQWPMQNPKLFVRTEENPANLVASLRQEIRQVLPTLPDPAIRPLSEHVGDSLAPARFQASLLALFGGLALLLATCGVYGVLAYAVSQRQREIGIRISLGASRGTVFSLILRQGMTLVLIGTCLGLAAATAVTRVLRSLLYNITPTDPVTFAVAGGLLLAAALFACWLPARKALQVDPIHALRHD